MIAPSRTRPALITALEASRRKRVDAAAAQARQHPAVSDERVHLEPEATPEEAEAVRRALAALGLIEPPAAEPEPSGDGEPAP